MKTDPRNATPVLGTTLRYSEEEWLLGGLFDIVPDAVVAVSRDGKIAKVNRQLELMFGYSQTELVGSPIEILVPVHARQRHLERRVDFQSNPYVRAMGKGGDLLGRRKDGSEFPVDIMLGPVASHAGGQVIAVIRDATAAKETTDQLEAQRVRLQTAVDNMPHGLLMYDRFSRLVVCNRRYMEMYGLSADVVVPGCTLRDLILHRKATGSFSGDVEQYCLDILAAVAKGETTQKVVETTNGRSIAIVYGPMADGGWVVTHEDITERLRAEKRLAHMAQHDQLTDLPNRALFHQRLEEALVSVRRGGALAVLYIDLDNFKNVNDTLGHPIGDRLLKSVAARLQACVREIDTLARLGGDEFAIIQTALSEPLDASSLAVRIRETMAQPFDLEVQQIHADCSIGISVAPNDGVDPDQLLKNADMALYAAKTNGRRAFQFFERQMDAQVKARRRLELDIKAALLEGEFELYYQPIVNLQSDRVSCCEALLRWHHPDRGMVLPGEFIAAAEEHGLIAAIGEWVLRTACTEAATWPDNIRVAVNVSPIQLMNRNWVETVVSVLATSGLPAPRLELELTEQALLSESDTILANLRRLRELGVRLVMDDFGVGFCSLNYLRRFPFDVIKFDRSFIKDIPDQGDAVAIVRAVAGLARSLGMTTTAEGVETQQQLDEIRALGCTDMQGYLFSVPRPVGELSQLLMPRVERKANAA